MGPLGVHCLLELDGCPPALLDDRAVLERALRAAAEQAGATWLGQVAHAFEPQGVTVVGLLAESHIALHTWPELGYAAADVFTCGDPGVARRACELLVAACRPARHLLRELERGPGLLAAAQARRTSTSSPSTRTS